VPGTNGADGAPGPQGAQGDSGGVSGYEIVSAVSVSNSTDKQQDVSCPAGKVVVGGGGLLSTTDDDAGIQNTYPLNSTTWRVTAVESGPVGGNWTLTTWAVCVDG